MDYKNLLDKLSNSTIDPSFLEKINNLSQNHRDPLTGLFDYRSFSWQLSEKLKSNHNFSLVAISLDFLQEINLISSWVIGDLAICSIAELLKPLENNRVIIGRTSGSTFMLYFPHIDVKLIRNTLKNISTELAKVELPELELLPEGHLTLSGGIFCSNKSLLVEEAIKEAGQRLAFAISQGGNKVVALSEKQTISNEVSGGNIEIKIQKKGSKTWQISTLLELSLSGLEIAEETPLLVRENLSLSLSNKKEQQELTLNGVIAWRKVKNDCPTKSEFFLGIKFQDLEQNHLEHLEQIMVISNITQR